MIRVGQRLREERERQRYSLEEVAKATKIRLSFLEAIEKGEYKKLPSSAYAQGFIKNYIEFLGLPTKEFLAIFRREFNEKEYIKVLPESFARPRHISVNKLRVRQAILLVVFLFLVCILYAFFQYKAAFFSPSLSIVTPGNNATVASQTIVVTGTTEPNVAVIVNGTTAYVDDNGKFRKDITVFPGTVTITVEAVNSFGRKTTQQRHITVR
ncbi:MAG TPA: helix-turn-helix domain-containing protein [Patescibacteria group bacterium]|nr:helix-turn-helix domain-containing protein [Patescibacteria group bacterium]